MSNGWLPWKKIRAGHYRRTDRKWAIVGHGRSWGLYRCWGDDAQDYECWHDNIPSMRRAVDVLWAIEEGDEDDGDIQDPLLADKTNVVLAIELREKEARANAS